MNPNQDHRTPIKRTILLVLGLAGKGKTTLSRLIHRRLERCIVIDDHDEFTDGVRIEAFEDLVDYVSRNCDGPFRVLYSSPTVSFEPMAPDSEFNRLIRFLSNVPDFVLFINEVSLYTTANNMPLELKKLISQGRREFIDIVATARRKTETHNLLTSQANAIVSFNQILPEDVHYMRSFVGEEYAEKIPRLEDLKFVWTNGVRFGEDAIRIEAGDAVGADLFLSALELNGGYVYSSPAQQK